MGWLAATPETPGEKGKVNKWNETRVERLQRIGADIPVIPVGAGEYMTRALALAGYTTRGEMGGERPLSWLEIGAFAAASGMLETKWETRLLREMSAAFLEGKIHGTHPMAKPYEVDD